MKKKLGGVVLALAAVAGGCAWYWPGRGESETLRLPGTIEVQEVRLGSKAGGRVLTVNAVESDSVEPGRVLVTFEPNELTARRDAAKARLASAQAALERADRGPRPEEIDEAKATADAARARLARAESGFRTEQKRQSESELEAAYADLRQAEADYSRVQREIDAGAGAKAELDSVKAARDRARSRVAVARAGMDLMATGSREEDKDEARADVARFDAHFRLLKKGTRDEDKAIARAAVAAAKADLDEAETNLREATVTAPERGVVAVVAVRPGDLVPAGRPVVVIHRTDDLWVKVFVPSTDLGRVKLGQAVEVAVDSHPGRRFAGTVQHIAPVSEFTPRNVQSADERKHQVFAVKVRVADPDGVFKSGMAAEVFVPLGK